MFKVYIAGGGTGGHLFPGISLAEAIREIEPDAHIKFLVSGRKLDLTLLEDRDFACERIEQRHLPAHPRQIGEFMLTNARALWQVMQLMVRDRPDVVIGLGGYASFAAATAAKLRGVPLVLLEQNVIPGKANRALSIAADRVFCQWTQAARYFLRRDNLRFAGNPIRESLKKMSREVAREKLTLAPGLKTLLVLGGSQGASALNRAMLDSIPLLKKLKDRIQVIHLTGHVDATDMHRTYREAGIKASVHGFLRDMRLAYSAADLVLCRAGGTTIAELTGMGLPCVLVPFPYATQNHQLANARALVSTGAARLIEQKNLNRQMMKNIVIDLLQDEEKLQRMSGRARFVGKPRAAVKIAKNILVRFKRRSEKQNKNYFALLLNV